MKSTSLSVSLALVSLATANGVLQLGIEGKRGVGRSPLRKRDTSGTVQTSLSESNLFVSYYANITMGTPPQNIRLIVDTGSSDIWAVASSADVCAAAAGCPGGTFDYSKSSTFVDNGPGEFQASYVDGTATTGDYFQDVFGIGSAKVEQMQMGLAGNTTSSEGIMGIAFRTGEGGGTVQYPNLVDTMVNQSIIATQAYSLWLDDRDARIGALLFGGVDTGKFDGNLANIAMYPSSTTGIVDRFTVAFTSLSITSPSGSDTLTPPGYAEAVVLDSGTTLTFVPDDLAQAIYNVVGANYDDEVQAAVCDCALGGVQGTLDFQFAGAQGPTIKVPVEEMVSPLFLKDGTQAQFNSGEPACIFGIGPSSSLGEDAPILFGDTVLRSAYVVYDLQNFRIGLAQTKFNSTDSNIVAFESFGAQIPSATTVTDESAVTQTAASAAVAPVAAPTAGSGSFSASVLQFTGHAGPGFATATGSTTPTSTSKPKKGAAAPRSNPRALLGLTVGVMLMAGTFLP